MKKIILSLGIAAILCFTSCSKPTAKEVNLANRADSASYALGAVIGSQLKDYQFKQDSLAQENPDKVAAAIIKGIEQALSEKEVNEFMQIGIQLGHDVNELKQQGFMNHGVDVNPDAIIYGLVNTLHDQNDIMKGEDADKYLNVKMREINERKSREKASQVQIQPVQINEDEADTTQAE